MRIGPYQNKISNSTISQLLNLLVTGAQSLWKDVDGWKVGLGRCCAVFNSSRRMALFSPNNKLMTGIHSALPALEFQFANCSTCDCCFLNANDRQCLVQL
jgi:hypothetical protein